MSTSELPQTDLELELFASQTARWPSSGRHILAQFDDASIVVYQAYRRSIGTWAIANNRLGGPEFSLSRMSWIKPNFLWMMYRSGWGTKPDQEMVLGIRIERSYFDEILRMAVPSSFAPSDFASREEWQLAVSRSDVRLQWDPDHLPGGEPTQRRAIQLGLRGKALARLVNEATLAIADMSEIVSRGRSQALTGRSDELMIPREELYSRGSAEYEADRHQTTVA